MSEAAQDRQARALEGIERHAHVMSKDLSDISNLMVEFRAILQEAMDAFDKFNQSTRDEDEKLLTPRDWMDYLRRWWNYESIDSMEERKLSKKEFFSYMQKTKSIEVTKQIPDHFKQNSGD
jgi:hypothetical protein